MGSRRRPLSSTGVSQARSDDWLDLCGEIVACTALGSDELWAARYEFPLPGSFGVDMMRKVATVANRSRSFNETIAYTDRGLKWAPLDWQLYFLRALGKVGARKTTASAVDDFRRARFLEPNGFEVPFEEGNFWLSRRPILAVTAWREALRRSGSRRPESRKAPT